MKKSERVDTSTCDHVWKPEPGMPGQYRCELCRASGHQPKFYKPANCKGNPHVPAEIQPHSCRTRSKKGGNGLKVCGKPAYAAQGGCHLHHGLRVGETDD